MNDQTDKRRARKVLARQLLRDRGVPLGADFHQLDSDTVERIIDAANTLHYRTPRHAPGSRARMFYQYANRG